MVGDHTGGGGGVEIIPEFFIFYFLSEKVLNAPKHILYIVFVVVDICSGTYPQCPLQSTQPAQNRYLKKKSLRGF